MTEATKPKFAGQSAVATAAAAGAATDVSGRFAFNSARVPGHLDLLKTGAARKHLNSSGGGGGVGGGPAWLDQSLLHALRGCEALTDGLLESVVRTECSVTREAQSVAKWADNCLQRGIDVSDYRDCNQKIFSKVSVLRETLDELSALEDCAALHQRNANEYLAFFYELHIVKDAMAQNLASLSEAVGGWLHSRVRSVNAERFTALLAACQALFEALDTWQFKVTQKQEQSFRIYPCSLRLRNGMLQQQQQQQQPQQQNGGIWCHALVRYSALCADSGSDGSHTCVMPREDLLLIDNSSEELWKVRNLAGRTLIVPATIILLPPPCSEAIDAAGKLRLFFFNAFTDCLKLVTKTIFWIVIIGIHEYSNGDKQYFNYLSESEVGDLRFLVEKFWLLFSSNWSRHPGFSLANDKLKYLSAVLDSSVRKDGNRKSLFPVDDFFLFEDTTVIVTMFKLLEPVIQRWIALGARDEVMTSQGHMLVHKSLLDLKAISQDDLSKLWLSEIQWEADQQKEAWDDPFLLTAEKHSTTDSSELRRHSKEEKTRYVITGIFDHRRDDYVSLEDAIASGIISADMSSYVNSATGERLATAEAMSLELIRVEATTSEVTKDEERSYGVITIRTRRETRPFVVSHALDPANGAWLPAKSAIELGIIDPAAGLYRGVGGVGIPVPDALQQGLVAVDYYGSGGEGEDGGEEITQSFTVVGVVNQRNKEIVGFARAVELGLIDPADGSYSDLIGGVRLDAAEAIRRGFLKVNLNRDPNSLLQQDPEKRAVSERLMKLRSIVRAVQRMQWQVKMKDNTSGSGEKHATTAAVPPTDPAPTAAPPTDTSPSTVPPAAVPPAAERSPTTAETVTTQSVKPPAAPSTTPSLAPSAGHSTASSPAAPAKTNNSDPKAQEKPKPKKDEVKAVESNQSQQQQQQSAKMSQNQQKKKK